MRGVFVFNKELRTIKQLGTSSGLLDTSQRYKANLESVITDNRRKLSEAQREKRPHLGWVLDPDNPYLNLWSLLILFLMLYSFILVPYLIAFGDVGVSSPWFIVDICVDFLFFIDILLTCNTAYYEKSGKLVISRREIFKNYLKGMLVVDCVSTFPMYLLMINDSMGSGSQSNSFVRFFRITKLSKLCKASKMLKLMKFMYCSQSMTKFLKLLKRYDSVTRLIGALNIVAIMSHFTACMWFFSAKSNEFGPETWVVRFNFQDEDDFTLYLISFYWAITTLTTVGFGDIYAVTPTEMTIAMLWMLFGVGFYSFVMGTLSSMITGMDANTAFLDGRLQLVDLFSKDTGLPHRTVKQIMTEVRSTTEGITLTESQRESVVTEMSRSLRFDVVRRMHDSASIRIEVLNGVNLVCLGMILTKMDRRTVAIHEALYAEGDLPEHVFFLMKGRVRFVISKRNLVFKTVVEGSFFGEAEILEKKLRQFSAEAETEVDVLYLSKEVFLAQLEMFPDYKDRVTFIFEQRKLKDKERMSELLDLLEAVEIRKEATFQDLAGHVKVTYSDTESDGNLKTDTKVNISIEGHLRAQMDSLHGSVSVCSIQELKLIAQELMDIADL